MACIELKLLELKLSRSASVQCSCSYGDLHSFCEKLRGSSRVAICFGLSFERREG
jgi:hypothetical protein